MSASCSSSGGGGSGGGGGGGPGGCGGPCGACKFLRRKCVSGCIFAPYFDSEQGATHFAAVHKVFGASNVSKLLLNIPMHKRLDAVVTICYEAQARLRDPVYGCVAHISALQQQVVSLQAELSYLQGHLATFELSQPRFPPPPQGIAPLAISLADLPSGFTGASSYDLSSLFDPMTQNTWAIQQRPMDPSQYVHGGPSPISSDCGGSSGDNDLQSLTRELLDRHGSPPTAPLPCSNIASSSASLSK